VSSSAEERREAMRRLPTANAADEGSRLWRRDLDTELAPAMLPLGEQEDGVEAASTKICCREAASATAAAASSCCAIRSQRDWLEEMEEEMKFQLPIIRCANFGEFPLQVFSLNSLIFSSLKTGGRDLPLWGSSPLGNSDPKGEDPQRVDPIGKIPSREDPIVKIPKG